MTESHHPSIAKLKRRENYSTWKIAMESLLQLDGLWKAILKIETNEEKITKARAKIILSVNKSIFVHVLKATTAQEAWKNLQSAFKDLHLRERNCGKPGHAANNCSEKKKEEKDNKPEQKKRRKIKIAPKWHF
ncbi:uncharacterized protein LOC120357971 [Solenopsis invicta]|uniref:uncharacterized protein LOC120357971 n=1 Tax=Solenopsis invicta TaxID=13686 RepID=UPI00193E17C3|nr:uncharacterized protein LOC120357971 [Solenopsis invicta]